MWRSEEDLRAMVGSFVDLCRRRGLKVNAGKIKEMVLGGEGGLEYEIRVDGARLEEVSAFWMNQAQMLPSVVGKWRVGKKL